MNKQRKLLIFSCFILIDALLIGCIFLLGDVTFSNVLKNEVSALAELDFTKDNFDTEVKSKGSYAVVEEAIKEYLDNYSVDVQHIVGANYDKTLNDLVLVENIVTDGPLFEDSFAYIESYRENFNDDVDELLSSSTSEDFINYINKYTNDSEDILLYKELIEENNFINEIEETKKVLELKRIDINSHFDAIVGVLEFLSLNKDYYYIENDEIKFTTVELYAEYVRLMNKTKRIYD